MTVLLYLLKASVLLVSAALAVSFRRRTSAATRHAICTLAVAGLLALPLLSEALPGWTVVSLPALPLAGSPQTSGVNAIRRSPAGFMSAPVEVPALAAAAPVIAPTKLGFVAAWLPLPALFLLIYTSGVCVLAARVVADHFRIARLRQRATDLDSPGWQALLRDCARQLRVRHLPWLLRSEDCAAPIAVGIRRQAIIMPAAADLWPDDLRRAVLLHELAHIARRDCLTQVAAALAHAVYWFHPGSWWLVRQLRIEREFACDDLVVSTGVRVSDYAGQLLALAYTIGRRQVPALAAGMAAPHQVETRILALLDGTRPRTAPSFRLRAAAIAVFVLAMLPLAVVNADSGQRSGDSGDRSGTAAGRTAGSDAVRRYLRLDYWQGVAAATLEQLAEQLQFVREMQQLGYSAADLNVLFTLRQHGVTAQYVRALADEGLSGLSSDELLKGVQHGVTPEYVGELNQLGYRPLTMDTLTRLRSHGVDGSTIRGMEDLGFSKLSIDALIRVQSHGISPEYVRELRERGYRWSLDDLIRARSHGIDADFLQELSSVGYEGLSLDRLALLRSHGVNLSDIREFQGLGYVGLSPESLAALRSHGVMPADARLANERAGRQLPIDELTAQAARGWR